MKRTSIVAGVVAAAVILVPGAVSAHGYNSDDQSWQSSQTATWNPDQLDTMYDSSENGTIVDALAQNGNFSTLVAAVKAAGLADTLAAPGNLTVFAPTDQAFANLPAGTVEALLADKPMLTRVLTNHVVAGRVDGDTAVRLGEANALSGNTLNIGYGDDGELYVDDARIITTDIYTTNGIIHVIDAVLVPQQ